MIAPRVNITLRLYPAEVEAVDWLAQKETRSRSQMLRLLIVEAVNARMLDHKDQPV